MLTTHYAEMEDCLSLAQARQPGALQTLIARLEHADWRVRVAAAVALQDLADPAAEGPLLALLRRESAEPLFSQSEGLGGISAGADTNVELVFPAGTTDAIKECWRRRGRVLQAAIWALAALDSVASETLAQLEHHATDQSQDYCVRAAANRALGRVGQASTIATLMASSRDPEWCTAQEGRESLTLLRDRFV